MSILNSNPASTVEDIVNATKIKSTEVEKILKSLDASNKIQWTEKEIRITDTGRGAIDDVGGFDNIVIKWKYSLSPEAPPLKPGGQSRPFCKKMMELARVYTREDIDTLSKVLGYDVWKLRGGWYHNYEKDVNLPHCRHEWRQVILRKKQNG